MRYPKKLENVHVEVIDQELCVYDWEQQQMHALNPTAAAIWQQCDGETAPALMATRLAQELNLPDAEKLVWLSLNRLEKAGLLQEKPTARLNRSIYTRREVLKLAGITLAMLPVVKSIVLPSAVEAQCSPNCVFSEFTQFLDGSCAEYCRSELVPNEVLCSSEVVGDVCVCYTVYPEPIDPEDCWGNEPFPIEPTGQDRRSRGGN
jgi:hypothetical protein